MDKKAKEDRVTAAAALANLAAGLSALATLAAVAAAAPMMLAAAGEAMSTCVFPSTLSTGPTHNDETVAQRPPTHAPVQPGMGPNEELQMHFDPVVLLSEPMDQEEMKLYAGILIQLYRYSSVHIIDVYRHRLTRCCLG